MNNFYKGAGKDETKIDPKKMFYRRFVKGCPTFYVNLKIVLKFEEFDCKSCPRPFQTMFSPSEFFAFCRTRQYR